MQSWIIRTTIAAAVFSSGRVVAQTPFFETTEDGSVLASIDDLNGDGIREMLVGGAAQVRILSGIDGSLFQTMTDANPAFGASVAALGDLDGDGTEEFVVGAPAGSSGEIVVFSGASRAILLRFSQPTQRYGIALADLPDLTADGVPDFAVGSSGTVWLLSGADAAQGSAVVFLSKQAPDASPTFGEAVARAGDVNGDGTEDWVAGDPFGTYASCPNGVGGGRAFVFSGVNGSLLHTLNEFDQCYASTYYGSNLTWPTFGFSVAAAGDVNADGFDDVLVGAPYDGASTGRYGYFSKGEVMVFSGLDGSVLHSYVQNGFITTDLGYGMAGLGDLNADGHDDFIVGGPSLFVGPVLGRASVYSGLDGTLMYLHELGYTTVLDVDSADVDGDGTTDSIFGGPTWTGQYAGNDLYLSATKSAGNVTVRMAQSTPGNLGALFVTSFQGAPVFFLAFIAPFDAEGVIELTGSSAAATPGAYELQAFAFNPVGRLVDSAVVALDLP